MPCSGFLEDFSVVMGVGEIEKLVEETEIKWKIIDFFPLSEDEFLKSPDFSFGNALWYLEIYKQCSKDREFMRLYICSYTTREFTVKYNFGLEKRDGSVEQLMKGILNKGQNENLQSEAHFIKESEIRQRKSELVPSGILTIRGSLKFETVSSIQPENLIKLDTLSENFKDLMANKESCDTTLHVQNKEYKAHRAVLIARSSVFAAMFLHETSEKQTGVVTIPDCDPESFEEFLKFIYCGKLEEPSVRSVLRLYETSDKYNVQELKKFCVEYLMQNLTVENLSDVVIFADQNEEGNLMSVVQDFFNKNLSKILQTPEWDCLVKNNYRLSKKLLTEMSSKMKAVD